ncbi:hypothetical protein G4228_008130 [Cervus hanglu yarkandensis]|nr:hypothetical protein G4228_008130 [Cervus hanglu yarkandensis]
MKVSDGSLLGEPRRTPLSKKEGVKWQRPRLTRQALMRCCLVKWVLSSAAPQGSEASCAIQRCSVPVPSLAWLGVLGQGLLKAGGRGALRPVGVGMVSSSSRGARDTDFRDTLEQDSGSVGHTGVLSLRDAAGVCGTQRLGCTKTGARPAAAVPRGPRPGCEEPRHGVGSRSLDKEDSFQV